MKSIFFTFILLFCLNSHGAIIEKAIEYKDGDQVLEGYLVYKNTTKNKAGILVVHDWMGLTQKTKEKAKELAKLGYVAFAADIYGKGIRPTTPEESGKLSGSFKSNRKLFRERLNLAYTVLKNIKQINTKKMAAIGFCFGGTGVLELARSGADLQAVVSFHGGLDSPEPELGKNIKAKVLAMHGADDPFVKENDLQAFENEMRNNKVDWELVKYGGAVHSFTDKSAGTDNSKGAAYNEKADKHSWLRMKTLFSEIL